ncbi:hypothetical protein O6H91_09G058400 [Diphasiastrum complanatum]|uniref:Uncharacterized protein n=1 Tax=Diphasiastrum complanatum TaxID=34168 RepID=A0ACC2CPT8_DIPCM|nr:hypothetical protein O6H91_Y176600 [Diphasiastrum complanatum]KAJ7543920.1 hypothetical protein O6H91_09G058400 [Diphasiastrum complanatum]
MDNAQSLLCEEEVIGSPWNENVRSVSNFCADEWTDASRGCFSNFPLDDDEAIARLLEKESSYMPEEGYLAALHLDDVCEARSTAVQWIVKVRNSYSFGPLTVALAVNYFDRYLSKHLSKSWKAWMIQLLSVACLSIAAKMEEIDVPLLLDLQIEGVDHVFEAKTIQRMELAILSSLGWRMSSVTVFSYVEELLHGLGVNGPLRKSLVIRVTELLLGSLSEADFLEFRPSVITLSALRCALEEVAPLQAEALNTALVKLFPVTKVNLDKCSRLMEELVADPVCSLISYSQVFGFPTSPITVAEIPQIKNAWEGVLKNCSNWSCLRSADAVPIIRCLNSRKRKLDDILK